MIDLKTQVRTYSESLVDSVAAVELDEVIELAVSAEADPVEEVRQQGDDDLIDYVPQAEPNAAPEEITTPTTRKRRIGVIASVAAAILLIVSVAVVVVDRSSDDIVTDSDSAPSVADPVSAPDQTEFLPPTGVVDSLGYRWTRIPHDEAIFGGDPDLKMNGVTVGGPGLVAVGASRLDAAVWTSVDGTTWSRVPHNDVLFGEAEMNSVTVGGPGLVAVGSAGSNAAVWTSVDGIDWSRVPHDEMVFGGGSSRCSGAAMNAVTVGGPGLVAVGGAVSLDRSRDAAVWTSVDGTTWSRVPHDEEVFGGETYPGGCYGPDMFAVTADGPGVVAGGWLASPERDSGNAGVWTSVDGLTWSSAPYEEGVFGGRSDLRMMGVTVGGPGLVAVGYAFEDAAVWTSVDGATWSRVPHDEAVFGGRPDLWMNGVTASGSGLVAVGEAGLDAGVWTSVDGATWSRVPHDEAVFGSGLMKGVTVGGPGLVAVGYVRDGGMAAAVWVATPEN